MTSPLTVRRISVTSSGRSSISSMMRCISGWFLATAWAMCWSRIVLPVRGGATIRPRCPLPIGVSRSMTRVVSGSVPVSRTICSCGSMGVRSSKLRRGRFSGASPSICSTREPGAARCPSSPVSTGPATSKPFSQAELVDQWSGHIGVGWLGGIVPGRVAQESRNPWDAVPGRPGPN